MSLDSRGHPRRAPFNRAVKWIAIYGAAQWACGAVVYFADDMIGGIPGVICVTDFLLGQPTIAIIRILNDLLPRGIGINPVSRWEFLEFGVETAAVVAIQCAALWLLWTLGRSWSVAKRSGVPV